MQGTYLRWYESAVSRFVSPLANIQRQAAVAALVAGEPIVIDETVLKVERCDWPAPDGLGFQIFGRNAQRVELCVVLVTLTIPNRCRLKKLWPQLHGLNNRLRTGQHIPTIRGWN